MVTPAYMLTSEYLALGTDRRENVMFVLLGVDYLHNLCTDFQSGLALLVCISTNDE